MKRTDAKSTERVDQPEKFGGVFASTWAKYGPLMQEARATLRALPVPKSISPYFEYAVLDRPQPGYMLLPLKYLAIADWHGGISQKHLDYLPWYVLAMEVVALLDDTVDHTPFRSHQMTYARRYGESSAAAMGAYLMSITLERTAKTAPEVLPMVSRFFETLCSLEVWELHSRYPVINDQVLDDWLDHRYEMATDVYVHSFNSALRIHGLEEMSREACKHFAAMSQGVDDLVGIVEARENIGENDDLKMGIVTYPLVATLRAEPRAIAALERVWEPCRQLRSEAMQRHLDELESCLDRTRPEQKQLLTWISQHAVRATVDEVLRRALLLEQHTPDYLRDSVGLVAGSYVDRLRDVDPRTSMSARLRHAS